MSERLEVRAEITRLARLLGLEGAELQYLAGVPAADLRVLRRQVTDVLFSDHGHAIGRLAASSRLLPVGLLATIAEKVFGPALCARIADRLEPERVVELGSRLPTGFLAELAIDLDPRRSREVLALMAPAQVKAISRELGRRGEYVAMGRFVSYLPPASIRAAADTFDDLSLLNVALFLEDKERLPEILGLLDPGRLQAMIAAAAGTDLEPEALDLLTQVPERQRAAIMQTLALGHRTSA